MTVSTDDRRPLSVRVGAEVNAMWQISRRPHDGAGQVGVPAGMGMGASTTTLDERSMRTMRLRLLLSAKGLPGAGQS